MSEWTDPRVSFNGATLASGGVTGQVVDLLGVKSDHAVQFNFIAGAGVTSLSLALEGSLDGTNWYALGAFIDYPSGIGAGNYAWAVITASGKPAVFLRTTGAASGGSVTSVTAYMCSR
jgi:hypothetical protein